MSDNDASNQYNQGGGTRSDGNDMRQQQQNRYAHLVPNKVQLTAELKDDTRTTGSSSSSSSSPGRQQVQTYAVPPTTRKTTTTTTTKTTTQANYNSTNSTNNHHQQQHASYQKAPPLAAAAGLNHPNANVYGQQQQQQQHQHYKQSHQKQRNNYYSSFSSVDWREQWLIFKEKTMEKVEEPECQRKLIMFIVCVALLLDNMLYMVIVPIIPDYLRSIGAWSTYTENAKWIRRNSSHGRTQWEQVGGQVVYEGEDSAVGFLFASKAIVQLIANPFSGAIADRIGYEIPMMFGLIVMFFSTMVFACGQTYSVLFLARSLQGVGSAFADTPGIAMLADRFTEETERRRAQGIAIAFISFGCLVAPPFGSVLYQGAGKEVPFIILSLVCLIDGSLLLLVAPPGTFSQLLPKYYYNNQPAPDSGTANAKANTTANIDEQRALNRVIVQPQREDSSLSPTPSPPPQPPPPPPLPITDGQSSEQGAEAKKRALFRQKSISRRHSMTMSAGEAPKGTPIEVLLKDPCIACCAGALVVANISLAFLEPTISIWVKSTMPDTEEWQEGMIWLPAFFPHVLGVFATLTLAEKYPKSTWIIASSGLVIEGLGCLVVPFCSTFWSLIIPISVICFGVALIDTAILPTLGYLVDTRFTSVYGNVYAIADISYSVSYAIGPIIAGGIVEAIGFTALNVLIAVVTLGYVPILSMLRSIRDYAPFEADPTGLAADRAKPFGQFGRAPIAKEMQEDNDDDEDDQDEYHRREQIEYQQHHQQPTSAKYESPTWAGGSSLKKTSSSTPKSTKSVTIVEDASDGGAGAGHQNVSPASDYGLSEDPTAKNPFLAQ